MPNTTTKLKPDQKPWERLGISYQQYYYRKRHHTLDEVAPAASNGAANGDESLRDKVLVDEFLDRCEARQLLAMTIGMEVSTTMANAIYKTLRQDGH